MAHTDISRTVADCCETCAEACRMTGFEGTVLKQPWIGTPIGKLNAGDVVRSFGAKDPIHVLGIISKDGKRTYVTWQDRSDPALLQGGVALRLHNRDGSIFTADMLSERVA